MHHKIKQEKAASLNSYLVDILRLSWDNMSICLAWMLSRPRWGPRPRRLYDEACNWASLTLKLSKPSGGQPEKTHTHTHRMCYKHGFNIQNRKWNGWKTDSVLMNDREKNWKNVNSLGASVCSTTHVLQQ